MKHFCFGLLTLQAIFFLLHTKLNAQQDTSVARYQSMHTINGSVRDNSNQQVLTGARVELLINGNSIKTTSTNSDGVFTMSIQKLEPFNVRISLAGYQTVNSSTYPVSRTFKNDLGTIMLYRVVRDTPTPRPTPPAPIKTTTEVITDHIETNSIFPTNGAYELMYALNPELRGKKEIPADYRIITPTFPEFKEQRRIFNNRFDVDKNKGEPFISFQPNSSVPDIDLAFGTYNSCSLFTAGIGTTQTKDYDETGILSLHDGIENNLFSFGGKPKKFVFVIWKYSADGKAITEGPEVEGHYKVVYFNDRVRNVSSNASYGYAPMYDSKYNIEVYNQKTGARLNASDDVIDPRKYFESRSLLILFNVSWTKIPIQVYE